MSKFKNLKLIISIMLIVSLVFVFNSCYAVGLDLLDNLTSNNESSDNTSTDTNTNENSNTSTNTDSNNSSTDDDNTNTSSNTNLKCSNSRR